MSKRKSEEGSNDSAPKRRSVERLGAEFFQASAEKLARRLLGQVVVRTLGDGTVMRGRVVETQAYLGKEDPAAHSYQGKQNPKNKALYMGAGTIYVANNFSKYSTHIVAGDESGYVLLRALQPLEGQSTMQLSRAAPGQADVAESQLCSGPANLSAALQVRGDVGKHNAAASEHLWVEPGDDEDDDEVVSCPRENLDKKTVSSEWLEKKLRFYFKGNDCLPGVHSEKASKAWFSKEKSGAAEKTKPKVSGERPSDKGLPKDFFKVSAEKLAKKLLGQILVRNLGDDKIMRGKIVETQAYMGKEDPACHSYEGKQYPKNKAVYMGPATIYVYNNFSQYSTNIVAGDDGSYVLLRALQPLEGQALMRASRVKPGQKDLEESQLCRGPSNLSSALQVQGGLSKQSAASSPELWVEAGPDADCDVVSCRRENLDAKKVSDDWLAKKLRFYVKNNEYVSGV